MMRHHFHRCPNLRLISLKASDVHGARRGGAGILEELCAARRFASCIGLAECDALPLAQKRELLVARATRLREEAGSGTPLAGTSRERSQALRALQRGLREERALIIAENRRLDAEATFALDQAEPLDPLEEYERSRAEVGAPFDDAFAQLRRLRLDAIDRALEWLAAGLPRDCAACGRPIEIARLQLVPDTRICEPCASEASRPE